MALVQDVCKVQCQNGRDGWRRIYGVGSTSLRATMLLAKAFGMGVWKQVLSVHVSLGSLPPQSAVLSRSAGMRPQSRPCQSIDFIS